MKRTVWFAGCCLVLGAFPVFAECPSADLTRDCFVDLADFAVISSQWLNTQTDLDPLVSQWLTGNRLPEDMIVISAGTFQMGDGFSEGVFDELPIHTDILDTFAMGKYEITNGQYCAFLKSAYPSQLKVVNGVVYSIHDTSNSNPYCDMTTSSSYSQIAFSNNTFSVRTKSGRDMTNDPMAMVSWYGAVAFCNWRSQQERKRICYNLSTWNCDFSKKGYRLATEAEWEYAARGGRAGNRFPWGDTINQTQANYYSYNFSYDVSPVKNQNHPLWNDGTYPYTSPVGFFDGTLKNKIQCNWPGSATSYQTASGANAYGLYDMAGNVWEWCHDWYGDYSSGSQTNPTGPETGSYHVFRGGSWGDNSGNCRVSSRWSCPPYYRSCSVGFRVVLDFE
jgi:formylglycine-generating enzyme required for sulfatase activity